MILQIVEFKDGRYGVRKWKWFKWFYFNIETKFWGTNTDVKYEPYFSGFRFKKYQDAELICKRIKVKGVSL